MKKLLLALSLFLGLSQVSYAQSSATQVVTGHYNPASGPNCTLGPCYIPDVNGIPNGFQQITSLSSAATLTVPTNSTIAVIICTGQTVNWRDDGTAPTASVGMPLPVDTVFTYSGTLSALQLIQTAATATCNVSYYK